MCLIGLKNNYQKQQQQQQQQQQKSYKNIETEL